MATPSANKETAATRQKDKSAVLASLSNIGTDESEEYRTLRQICLGLPGVSETAVQDQVIFKVGQRPFVIVETYRGDGRQFHCVAFKASFLDREQLSKDSTYFSAPYLGGSGWLGRKLNHPTVPINWSEMAALISRSHRQIAGRVGRVSA